ncbi:fluoride efflux transporter CrcB [Zooshikella harenae]|uniref:Fluoride-specific ion channel FluC n=1 Tax=Zooshikella harenae TaxID=2827238 RepID=A0ABS5ZDU5_9GAMM|nr:fluoride efflux transporter CrcB [Zooshikella harenae]MBU2712238.1 fluoride efflux transporter CrcB [Zooshikella harenae]
MQQLLIIGLGGALGAMARYSVYFIYATTGGKLFPLPTLLVNVVGSFLIGIAYYAIVERLQLQAVWRNGLIVGFLGAFTTFSTYSLDALRILQNGELSIALGYLLLSVVLCLIATWLGFWLVERFLV